MLIMVVVAMVALLAFGAFVIDYGVMWTGRGQIQTSADAGALAGAIALAFDSPTDFAGAKAKAQAVARANNVWGAAPDVAADGRHLPAVPAGRPRPAGHLRQGRRVPQSGARQPAADVFRQPGRRHGPGRAGDRDRADRHRQQDRLPQAVGDPRPLDRVRSRGPGHARRPSTYDKYSDGKGQSAAAGKRCLHRRRAPSSTGTGFTLPADLGRRFAVKTEGTDVSSGWFREIQLPRAEAVGPAATSTGTTSDVRRSAVRDRHAGIACPADIGQADAAYWATQGCFGVKTGEHGRPDAAGHRVSHRPGSRRARMATRRHRRQHVQPADRRARAWSRSA